MGKTGSFSATDLKKLQKQLNQLAKNGENSADAFLDSCARELAARLLAKVIKRTPVGDYSREITVTAKRNSKHHKKGDTYKKRVNPSGKLGGTLRRGWTSKTHEEAVNGSRKSSEAVAYANSLEIKRSGNMLIIEIVNPVRYAPYVEFGHRTADKRGWVPGQFMLSISEQELQDVAPKVLESKIKKYLNEVIY